MQKACAIQIVNKPLRSLLFLPLLSFPHHWFKVILLCIINTVHLLASNSNNKLQDFKAELLDVVLQHMITYLNNLAAKEDSYHLNSTKEQLLAYSLNLQTRDLLNPFKI